MNKPELIQDYYGAFVWCDPKMDELRRKRCLCLRCGVPFCATAEALFEICKARHLAVAITRCKNWEPVRKGEML